MQILDDNTICFRSIKEYWTKEKNGSKKNTVRRLDDAEKRNLNLWIHCLVHEPKIRIVLDDCNQPFNTKTAFERTISDITEWEGLHIFSWR